MTPEIAQVVRARLVYGKEAPKRLCNTEQHGKSNIRGTSQRTLLEDSENKRRKLTTTKVTSKVNKQSSNSNRSTKDNSAKIEWNSGRQGDL